MAMSPTSPRVLVVGWPSFIDGEATAGDVLAMEAVAAEEAKRIEGSIVALDWLPGNEGRRAEIRRVPLGVIAGISPFNFPLNLVAHKVAPAIAAGNPILLRPASTPSWPAIVPDNRPLVTSRLPCVRP